MATNNYNLWMIKEGHKALAKLFKERSDYHLGVGGCGAETPWTTSPPVPNFDAVAMLEEFGRRKVTQVSYAEEDAGGDIGWDGSLWSTTTSVTRHVYLKFAFETDEAVNLNVYQVAIFVGTVPQGIVPPGQFYLEPADVLEAGTIMYSQYIVPRIFSEFEKPVFEFILTF